MQLRCFLLFLALGIFLKGEEGAGWRFMCRLSTGLSVAAGGKGLLGMLGMLGMLFCASETLSMWLRAVMLHMAGLPEELLAGEALVGLVSSRRQRSEALARGLACCSAASLASDAGSAALSAGMRSINVPSRGGVLGQGA